MDKGKIITTSTIYLKKYWFQITLSILFLFFMMNKELSLSLNLNNPAIQEPTNQPVMPTQSLAKEKKEKYTDRSLADNKTITVQKSSILDRLSLPFIGGNRSEKQIAELAAIDEATKLDYIERFSKVAQNEQAKFDIPASIILANGLVHSFAGQRDISINGYNYFGLRCTNDWQGPTKIKNGDCYRAYDSAWMSFRDHSLFLRQGSHEALRNMNTNNVVTWAKQIEKARYSDLKEIKDLIITVIERYELQRFDNA